MKHKQCGTSIGCQRTNSSRLSRPYPEHQHNDLGQLVAQERLQLIVIDSLGPAHQRLLDLRPGSSVENSREARVPVPNEVVTDTVRAMQRPYQVLMLFWDTGKFGFKALQPGACCQPPDWKAGHVTGTAEVPHKGQSRAVSSH